MAEPIIYVVAKYIPDLLRQEPRNIGVFVFGREGVAGRLVGEDAMGQLNLRRVPVGTFNDGDVYAEWHAYWRRLLVDCRDPGECSEDVIQSAQGTFQVWAGGEVFPESPETPQALCDDLYSRLVFPLHPAMLTDADTGAKAETRSPELGDDIATAFDVAQILASKPGQAEAFAGHPVLSNVPVKGSLPEPHLPRFVQENGLQYVMEHVDFTRSPMNSREHSGYAAYMLGDLRSKRKIECIAIVNRLQPGISARKENSKGLIAQKYGLGALGKSKARIVKWDDPIERRSFLLERVKVARASHR